MRSTLASDGPPRLQGRPGVTPFLKWPGGKSQEMPAIAALAPDLAGRLVDPFVGGGSILFATPATVPAVVNDACGDLVAVFRAVADEEPAFGDSIVSLGAAWDALAGPPWYADLAEAFVRGEADAASTWLAQHRSGLAAIVGPAGRDLPARFLAQAARDLPGKFARIRAVERNAGRTLDRHDLLANVEGAVRSAFYMSVRARYNEARVAGAWDACRAADFLFLRELGYAAMFRFNARDESNVPYGGVSYNRKSLAPKIRLMREPRTLERLANTTFACGDFEPFLDGAGLTRDDFLFVDPPYDSDFSRYDNRPFGRHDQVRLRDVLEHAPARVMVVIKDAPAVRELYGTGRWRVVERAKTYMWTIKSRNDREATHLVITNY